MNIDMIWEKAMNVLRQMVNSDVGFNLYLKDAVVISYENNEFVIAVKMSLNKSMIENRFKEKIEQILTNIIQNDTYLKVVVSSEPEKLRKESQAVTDIIPAEQTQVYSYALNPKYSFENFIIGASNEYATAAAIRVAENPGVVYNPIFLYGNSGLGKTHLMHAIGNKIKKLFPDKKIIYVTSEKFMNDFIENVRKKTPMNFKEFYRSADVLLIDDIQFLEKKESTQDELFHTFNELYNMNKQIVITSDRLPKNLVTLEERLRTRFECGLTIDITAPSLETRIAILKNKAEAKNITMPEEVYQYIADCVQSNVRELEGALNKIVSFSQIKDQEITLEFAQECINSYANKVSADKIIDKVCSYYGITKEDIIGKSKLKNIALPRQVAMYICDAMTELNYGAIAKNFGNRDRTTAFHNIEKIKDQIKNDNVLSNDIECIVNEIKGS